MNLTTYEHILNGRKKKKAKIRQEIPIDNQNVSNTNHTQENKELKLSPKFSQNKSLLDELRKSECFTEKLNKTEEIEMKHTIY